jgi:hypothetical protein
VPPPLPRHIAAFRGAVIWTAWAAAMLLVLQSLSFPKTSVFDAARFLLFEPGLPWPPPWVRVLVSLLVTVLVGGALGILASRTPGSPRLRAFRLALNAVVALYLTFAGTFFVLFLPAFLRESGVLAHLLGTLWATALIGTLWILPVGGCPRWSLRSHWSPGRAPSSTCPPFVASNLPCLNP